MYIFRQKIGDFGIFSKNFVKYPQKHLVTLHSILYSTFHGIFEVSTGKSTTRLHAFGGKFYPDIIQSYIEYIYETGSKKNCPHQLDNSRNFLKYCFSFLISLVKYYLADTYVTASALSIGLYFVNYLECYVYILHFKTFSNFL